MVSAVLFPLYSDGVGAFFPIDYIYIYNFRKCSSHSFLTNYFNGKSEDLES